MRNQRPNFIAAPVKSPKARPAPHQRKTSISCQTERVVFIKEENLSFQPCSRLGQSDDGGMRRDYVKAVNYINSCHKFINNIIEKNNPDKSNVFLLPLLTNFVPLFPHLVPKKPKRDKEEPKRRKPEERKWKSSFAVKQEDPPHDPTPMGDCEKGVQESSSSSQVADLVKEQVQLFLGNLQEDMNKAMKTKTEQKCKNLDIVKQRLEELTQICVMQKSFQSHQIIQLPPPPPPLMLPPIEDSAQCSAIQSDTEFATTRCLSTSSFRSDSSEIKSDSEFEINQ